MQGGNTIHKKPLHGVWPGRKITTDIETVMITGASGRMGGGLGAGPGPGGGTGAG